MRQLWGHFLLKVRGKRVGEGGQRGKVIRAAAVRRRVSVRGTPGGGEVTDQATAVGPLPATEEGEGGGVAYEGGKGAGRTRRGVQGRGAWRGGQDDTLNLSLHPTFSHLSSPLSRGTPHAPFWLKKASPPHTALPVTHTRNPHFLNRPHFEPVPPSPHFPLAVVERRSQLGPCGPCRACGSFRTAAGGGAAPQRRLLPSALRRVQVRGAVAIEVEGAGFRVVTWGLLHIK